MNDIIKALILGWSIVWAMSILSFTIFQGGQLVMMFVFAQAPWSIPVSFTLVWLAGALLIIALPYTAAAISRKKTNPAPKQDVPAAE